MNRKVWIITESSEFCIGTVGQILADRCKKDNIAKMLKDVVNEMINENDDFSTVSFEIEIRF